MLFQSPFSTRSAQALQVIAFGHQHLRVAAAVLLVLAMGGGGGAYALSQANQSAQEALGQVGQVVEAVEPLPFNAEAEASANDFTLYHSSIVRKTDSNASLLKRLGVRDAQALQFINQNAQAKKLSGYSGRSIAAQTNPEGQLQSLMLRYPQGDGVRFTRLSVKRDAQGQLQASEETGYLQAQPALGYATVRGTIYAAMDAAHIPDAVGDQLISIFSNEIDFQRNLKRGDSFKIAYEVLTADGEAMGAGRVLGAEFVNGKQTYSAVWFQEASSKGGYYSLSGESLHKAYLAAPLKFTRITSGFGMREHPIWHGLRPHKGVDYGAPIGTPIMAMADGTVKFAGWQNGYGNCVELQHANGRSTFYAHMSKIAVRQGEKIAQSEVIGNVGATGWATGPHLHFEFRINEEYQSPDLMAQETGTAPLSSPRARQAFAAVANSMRTQFASAHAVQLASLQ